MIGLPARAPCDSCGRDCPGCAPERRPVHEDIDCPACGGVIELAPPRFGHRFDVYPLGHEEKCRTCGVVVRCVEQDAYGDSEGDDSTWRWAVAA